MDTTRLASFAFSPLKIAYSHGKFFLKMNPFGTYFGKQYVQPTWGEGTGYDVALVSADQYSSSATTYNGHQYRFELMIAFFEGRVLPGMIQTDLITFAKPPFVVSKQKIIPEKAEWPLVSPKGLLAVSGKEGIYFHWEKVKGSPVKYNIYCGTKNRIYDVKYEQQGDKTTLHVLNYQEEQSFELDQLYFITVTAVDEYGVESEKAAEIEFVFKGPQKYQKMEVPITIQLKILWATIRSYLD